MKFPCTSCGACCRLIGLALAGDRSELPPAIKAAFDEFPYKAREDGSCEQFVDGKCAVYDKRPKLCNINKMARAMKNPIAEHHKRVAVACNTLQREQGIDESFRIPLALIVHAADRA